MCRSELSETGVEGTQPGCAELQVRVLEGDTKGQVLPGKRVMWSFLGSWGGFTCSWTIIFSEIAF